MRNALLGLGLALAGATAASAALPAATGNTESHPIAINARVTAQCVISGDTVANIDVSLAGNDGFLASGLQGEIEQALAGTGTQAWCSGANNRIRLEASPLVRNGSNGNLANGFVQAVGYSVSVDVPGAQNLLFPAQPDAASDIPVTRLLQGRFGASGNGATLAWDGGYLNLNPQPVTVSGGLFGLPTIETGRRLAAGDYTSTVVLTLTPGV